MTAETPRHLEQDPERVRTIREDIRRIYALEEVSQAVIEHFMGRVDEYSAEQFRKNQEVTIKKGVFAFHFYPRIRPDRDSDCPKLVMARTPLLINLRQTENSLLQPYITGIPVSSYTLAGRIRINASSPDKIEVSRNSDWLYQGGLKSIHGQEALDISEKVIDSFIHPENQKAQVPQV